MGTPSRVQLLQAAKVFGLGGDVLGNTDRYCGTEKIMFFSKYNLAHVTRVEHVHITRDKPLYSLGSLGESKIVMHDAAEVRDEFFDWEKQPSMLEVKSDGTLVGPKKRNRDEEFAKRYLLEEATFAATELNGIPERIFLFSHQPRFDIESIIYLLGLYRGMHPLPHIRDLKLIYANH